MSKRTKESKKRINSLVLLIAFTAILLIASTYAWFSTQKNISINNLKGRVEVAEGLQVSFDAENWFQEIYLGTAQSSSDSTLDLTADWTRYDNGIGNHTYNIAGTNVTFVSHNSRPIMKTVSDQIPVTGSADNSTGYLLARSTSGMSNSTGNFASDNRVIIPFYDGVYTYPKLSEIKQIASILDNEKDNGYYAFDMYLMNTSKPGSSGETLQLNFNSCVDELKLKSDGKDFGLKNAVRVAFGLYDKVNDAGDNQEKVITTQNVDSAKIKQVAIWEPNFDTHSEYVMSQNSELRRLAANAGTTTDSNYPGIEYYNAIETYAVRTNTVSDSSVSNVYSTIDPNLQQITNINRTSGYFVGDDKGIYKDGVTESVVSGSPMLNGKETNSNQTGVINLIDTYGEEITLPRNSITRMRVYIWLEGQDPDCINWATQSDGIKVDIGLCKGSIVGTTSEKE